MNSRVEQAIERHEKGYNCAQAVACTYCDLLGVDEDTVYRLAEGFGLGMGIMQLCGALSGALMVTGLKGSGGMELPGTTKGNTYMVNRDICRKFEEEAGSLICRELKSAETGTPRFSCSECIRLGARLVEENLL